MTTTNGFRFGELKCWGARDGAFSGQNAMVSEFRRVKQEEFDHLTLNCRDVAIVSQKFIGEVN